ncbi:flavin reductase [Microbacterium timonense]|uniref:flavin reductase n=1 Tax=Microbacterium timonense TaxID=2086576 RepID=UPI001357FDD8|nr:flavin reductase [Microbacterium timonense]
MATVRTPIDPVQFREVMGNYPTGVTVVTAVDDAGPIGMVVGTFSSVSLDPPLVAFLPQTRSGTYARLRNAGAYCINVLAHDQVDVCRLLSGPDPDKFDKVEWKPSSLGAPMIEGAVAYIHCSPRPPIDAGDHYIALCDVLSLEANRQTTPLLFFQGGYGGFSPHGMTAYGDADLIEGIRLAAFARPQIELLAREQQCEAAVLVAVTANELTTVGSAYGGEAKMSERIGERLPMKPPLGEAFIAWAPDAALERWLSGAARDPETVESLRQRLATLRAQGYAVSQIGPEGGSHRDQLVALMAEYAAGDLTPARERSLLGRMAQLMHFFDTSDFDDDGTYNLGGVMAPVLNEQRNIVMLLRLSQLPQSVDGRQVKRWISEIRAAAAAVESELRADDSVDLDQSLAWARSMFA